jgi:hypothetical protein
MIKRWFKLTDEQKEKLVLVEEKSITLDFSIGLYFNPELNEYLLLTNNFKKVVNSEIVDDYATYLQTNSIESPELTTKNELDKIVTRLKEQKYEGLFISITNSCFITWWYRSTENNNDIIFTFNMHLCN